MTDDLIARLEQAERGSRELDIYIGAHVNGRDVHVSMNNELLGTSRAPPHDVSILGWIDPGKHSNNFSEAGRKPPYPQFSTSLDAKLPGENIVEVRWTEFEWMAVQKIEGGGHIEGKARTEPLARRVACLKAMEAENV